MRKYLDTSLLTWKNKPNNYAIGKHRVIMETMPFTDLWAKTHYQFTHNNAPSLTFSIGQNFTFSCKVKYQFKNKYDQAGLLVYANDENWFKVCVEYIDEQTSLVSTVVTFHGFSDWSSYTIGSAVEDMWFRVSHSEQDFFVENSFDGIVYKQMRMFHMKLRGQKFKVGFFAASPLESSFDAVFSDMIVEDCLFEEYRGE